MHLFYWKKPQIDPYLSKNSIISCFFYNLFAIFEGYLGLGNSKRSKMNELAMQYAFLNENYSVLLQKHLRMTPNETKNQETAFFFQTFFMHSRVSRNVLS